MRRLDSFTGAEDTSIGSSWVEAGEDLAPPKEQDRGAARIGGRQPSPPPPVSQVTRGRQKATGLSQIGGERPIFTLSVAADLLGLHPRTLRIYEEKKLVIPARTEGNRRRYSQNDIQKFQFIRHLTKAGVNLEGVRIILDMADELTRRGGDPTVVIERNLQIIDES